MPIVIHTPTYRGSGDSIFEISSNIRLDQYFPYQRQALFFYIPHKILVELMWRWKYGAFFTDHPGSFFI